MTVFVDERNEAFADGKRAQIYNLQEIVQNIRGENKIIPLPVYLVWFIFAGFVTYLLVFFTVDAFVSYTRDSFWGLAIIAPFLLY